MEKTQIIGKILQEVLSKYFKGNYELVDEEKQDAEKEQNKVQFEVKEVNDSMLIPKKTSKFIVRNKMAVASFKRVLKESMGNTQRLVETNIPKLQANLRIGRVELYSFYILFKALSVVSSQILNHDGSFNTEGVHYEMWKKGIFKLNMMSEEMAKRVYVKIDESMEGILDWGEFLKGMQIINAKTKLQMMDLFVNLADTNRNGYLNFEELCEISKLALKKYFSSNDSLFFNSLANYFARFIYETCETPFSEKLRIARIKELIVEGHPNSNLIIMFCGADM